MAFQHVLLFLVQLNYSVAFLCVCCYLFSYESTGVQHAWLSLISSVLAWYFSAFTVACLVQSKQGIFAWVQLPSPSYCCAPGYSLLPGQFRLGMAFQHVHTCLFSSGLLWCPRHVHCCLFSSGVAWRFIMFTAAPLDKAWRGIPSCSLLPVHFSPWRGIPSCSLLLA